MMKRSLSAILLLSNTLPAVAEIADYQVLRFLYLQTGCGFASIQRTDRGGDGIRFLAECQNKTAFPDGALVFCPDADDDRTCAIANAPTEFKQLELLRKFGEPR